MKSVLVITLSFLLFAKFEIALAKDAEDVVDKEGKRILPGGEYYVLPPPSYGGGGLILQKTGDSTCPLSVLQQNSDSSNGQLLRFNVSRGRILTGSKLDIEFVEKPECVKSSKWKVVYENDNKTAFVGIGGPEDHPGKKTILSGKFQIERHNYNYKLVFCESGSIDCSRRMDIGKYKDDKIEDGKPLKLTEHEPFEITFLNPKSVSLE